MRFLSLFFALFLALGNSVVAKGQPDNWTPPIAGAVSYGFYNAAYLQSEGVNHVGVDIPADVDAEVVSPVDGTVIINRTSRADIMQAYMVIREEKTGIEHVLGHIASALPEEATVKRGQPVGSVRHWAGNEHVHWGAFQGRLLGSFDGRWGWGRVPASVSRQEAEARGWIDVEPLIGSLLTRSNGILLGDGLEDFRTRNVEPMQMWYDAPDGEKWFLHDPEPASRENNVSVETVRREGDELICMVNDAEGYWTYCKVLAPPPGGWEAVRVAGVSDHSIGTSPITTDGMFGVSVGTKIEDIAYRFDVPGVYGSQSDDWNAYECEIFIAKDGLFSVLTEKGKIGAINTASREIATLSGAKVGMTAEQLRRIYGDRLTMEANPYVEFPGADYFVYSSSGNGVKFSVGESGRVESITAGGSAIRLVEGCL